MRSPKRVTRFFEGLLKQPSPLVRYLLPFVAIAVVLITQFGVAHFVPKSADFPYVFFYLIAIFATAWVGGYGPGAITCLITMIGIPLVAVPGFRLTSVDPSRLVLLVGVSALVSLVAQSQRKKQEQLRDANDELDKRVQHRTQELARVVKALESEVVQHTSTEKALRRSEARVDLALDAAGIGRWDHDLVTGQVDSSQRHEQIFGHDRSSSVLTRATLFEHVLAEDRAVVEEKFQGAVDSGGVCDFECRVQHPEGNIRWVWGRGKVLHDDQGRAVSLLGSSRDITDRKIAEQRLKTQLERLKLLGQITRSIGERQDLRSIFQVVITACRSISGASACTTSRLKK
jgi:PAS domain S-box-containing protein